MSDVRIYHSLPFPVLALTTACLCAGANLTALPEHFRPDPFGAIVEPDQTAEA
jgi:hypothetical protein